MLILISLGTASGKTYYSTYLTTSYHTHTVTATTTEVEVVCPATSVPYGPESTPTNSPYSPEHNNGGYGSEAAGYRAMPTSSLYAHGSPEYPASTTYGPSYAPTSGTCAPSATTIYSTVVVTKTAGVESVPTGSGEYSTYHITLPNGYATSVVVPAEGKPTYAPVHNAPYPYHHGHGNGGSSYYPYGSGTVSVYQPTGTGTAAPSGSAGYGYGGYGYSE